MFYCVICLYSYMKPLLLGKRIVYQFTLCAFGAFAGQKRPHRIHYLNSLKHTHMHTHTFSV